MGTRAAVCFWQEGELVAQVLRSGDGYPSGLGADLQVFLKKLRDKRPHDTRFDQVGTLAARWVHYEMCHYDATHMSKCAIFMDEFDDIEYRYHINWNSEKNQLTVSVQDLDKDEETLMFVITHTH